jgi:NAD(P)-dependent dehydrogenase (short-subunit alcohol dehydrogenase family)
MLLRNKRVLLTGAARRLGRLFTLACVDAGAAVVIHFGHSSEEAHQLAHEIEAAGGRAELIQADLGDEAELAKLVAAVEKLGPLDALVNNAAIFDPVAALTISRSDWDRSMAVNLTAPMMLSQAFARQLPPERSGQIINILDWRALRPGPDHLPYTVSKAGLAALTKSLAIALAPHVRVNGLALGAVLPPTGQAPEPGILAPVPLGRWALPGEAERALIFLLAQADYVTGEIIHLDGGRHLI